MQTHLGTKQGSGASLGLGMGIQLEDHTPGSAWCVTPSANWVVGPNLDLAGTKQVLSLALESWCLPASNVALASSVDKHPWIPPALLPVEKPQGEEAIPQADSQPPPISSPAGSKGRAADGWVVK